MCHVGLELDSTYYLTTLKAVQGIRGASWRYEKRPQIAGCTSLKVWNFQSFIFDTYWPIQPELIQIIQKHSKTEVATKYVPHFSSIYGPFKKRPRFEGHLRRCIKICSYVNL